MGGFKAALTNEIVKIFKRKKAVAAVVISLAVIVVGQLVVIGIRNGFGLRAVNGMEFSIIVLSVLVNTVLPLFTALVAIDAFTGEISHNTMRVALTCPVSRLTVFSAKTAAAVLFALANLVFTMVLSVLTGFLFNAASASFFAVLKIVLAYLVTIIPVAVLAIVIVFIANILKGSTSAFFLSVLVFLACKALEIIYSQYSSLFFTSMLDWYNLWIAESIPVFKILREFLIMAGCGIMFFAAGYYLFEKKDL